MTIVLVDLSSIAYPIYLTSSAHPDRNHASQQIAGRVKTLAMGHPHVAVCCDSGRSFRRDIDPNYKANRPERDEVLHHQIKLAVDALKASGFPVWAVPGFEADDLIASATAMALKSDDADVLIVTGDKDLAQLIGPRVRIKGAKDGGLLDAEGVKSKFGVHPAQMLDYLSLVGDASDNVKGAAGIGPIGAAKLLAKFDSLDRLYEEMREIGSVTIGLTSGQTTALKDFLPRWPVVRSLISLKADVAVPFDDLLAPRVAQTPARKAAFMNEDDEMDTNETTETAPATPDAPSGPVAVADQPAPPDQAIAVRPIQDVLPPQTEYERHLDPRNIKEAKVLALDMAASAMFSAYGTPEAILSTIMVGRELGIPAMTSLRCIYNVEGKHALSAQLIIALVLKSGLCEYFELDELTDTSCTYVTKRRGARKEQRLTHTIESAKTAGLLKEKSNWLKVPQDMLNARCSVRLARIVYPDICANVYTPDELEEIRTAAA